jgi:hypothetical protein
MGEGSLQALSLAIRLIASRLGHLLEEKEELVYPDDRSRWDLACHTSVFGAINAR